MDPIWASPPPPCQNYSHAGARRQKEITMPMFTLVTNEVRDTAATYDEHGSLIDYGHVDDVTERLIDRLKEAGVLDVRRDTPTMQPDGPQGWGSTYSSLDDLTWAAQRSAPFASDEAIQALRAKLTGDNG